MIKNEKLQRDINRKGAKISALLSGKIHKYEYLTGKEILPSNKSRVTKQTQFTYSLFSKAFEKQIKTIKNEGIKQVKVLKSLKPEENKEDIKSIQEIFPKDKK